MVHYLELQSFSNGGSPSPPNLAPPSVFPFPIMITVFHKLCSYSSIHLKCASTTFCFLRVPLHPGRLSSYVTFWLPHSDSSLPPQYEQHSVHLVTTLGVHVCSLSYELSENTSASWHVVDAPCVTAAGTYPCPLLIVRCSLASSSWPSPFASFAFFCLLWRNGTNDSSWERIWQPGIELIGITVRYYWDRPRIAITPNIFLYCF